MNKILINLFILVSMSSCTHYYYMPATQNVPLFKEKDEYRASISLGTGDETTTADIQTAYAFNDKFALMTNFMLAWGGDDHDGGKGQYIDAAFGYFQPLGKHGVFEIFEGIGGSKQHHQYVGQSLSKGTADLSFTKIFIQPSIGLTYNAFDIAFTSCFSNINFHKVDNNIDPSVRDYYLVDLISRNKNSFLFEPSLTIRGGWKNVKLQLQAGLSQNLFNAALDFETFKLSVGLTFAFGQRFGKKNMGTHSN
jgi:hypothetical protein